MSPPPASPPPSNAAGDASATSGADARARTLQGSAPLVLAGIAPLDLPLAWPLHALRVALRLHTAAQEPAAGAEEAVGAAGWRLPSATEASLLQTHLPQEQVAGLRIEERWITAGATFPAGPSGDRDDAASATAATAIATAAGSAAAASTAAASAPPPAFLPEAGLFVEGARAAALVLALGLKGDTAMVAMRTLGGPAWQGREAHRLGVVLGERATLCARQHPPLLAHPPTRPLYGGALVRRPPATVARRRHLPEQVHLRKARDQAARAGAALLALAHPDPAPLRELMQDVVVADALGPHVPGFFPARAAALGAGALACGLAPESDTLLWLAPDATSAQAAGDAARLVLAAHRIDTHLLVSPLFGAHESTHDLPDLPDGAHEGVHNGAHDGAHDGAHESTHDLPDRRAAPTAPFPEGA